MKKDKGILDTIKYCMLVFVSALSTVLLLVLAFSAFLKTAVANNMVEQYMLVEKENILLLVLLLAGVLVGGYFLVNHMTKERLKFLLLFTILWNIFWGGFLILFARSAPGADALTVFVMAGQFAHSDLSFIDFTDSYLSYYPQQVGLTVFLGFLIKLIELLPFEVSTHHFIKGLYTALNCVTVFYGFKTVEEIWSNERISAVFLYLSILNLPFIMYSSFIYGEIPSICAMTLAGYFLVKASKEKFSVLYIVAGVFSLAAAVFVRKNSLIFMIAFVIVMGLLFLEKKKSIYLVFAIAAVALSVSVLPFTQMLLENRSGAKLNSGVTMYSYLAMGMQDGNRGPGWYNGFNFDTYRDTGMNTKKTNELSSEAIKERKDYFKNNRKEAVKFYTEKFLTQWSDPTLASCQATYADFGGRSDFMEQVYNGKYNKIYIAICNLFQELVYIGAFLWCGKNLLEMLSGNGKKECKSVVYLGIITVIGGFIFHMFWEANSRYIFPYVCMLVPYAACGFGSLFKHNYRLTDSEKRRYD
ncbi:MAG: hypothetical protein K5776_04095 [Lachnospiraceae bacterium]|nr:hypothetical protein [Lachnospiraceae bacterium]